MEYNIQKLINKEYLNVYEEPYLEDVLEYIYATWRDIIIPHSNKYINDLNENQQNIIYNAYNKLNIENQYNKNISLQDMDKLFISYILKIAFKLKNIKIVDFIYKRTKSAALSAPNYFYYKQFINFYLSTFNINKAINILEYIYNLNSKPYLYYIINISIEKYISYPEYYKSLKIYKYKSIVKLLKMGEKITYDIDLDLIKNIYQYI